MVCVDKRTDALVTNSTEWPTRVRSVANVVDAGRNSNLLWHGELPMGIGTAKSRNTHPGELVVRIVSAPAMPRAGRLP